MVWGQLPRILELAFASQSALRALPLLERWKGSGIAKARSPELGSGGAKGAEPRKIVT